MNTTLEGLKSKNDETTKVIKMFRRHWFIPFLCFFLPSGSDAILPTAELIVNKESSSTFTVLASQASFGSDLKTSLTFRLEVIDSLLCENITEPVEKYQDTILLVPRGECTYKFKAFQAQQLGAKAIVIYNNLASRYSMNTTRHQDEKYPSYTHEDIIFPQSLYDYDCRLGESSKIPTKELKMTPWPYNSEHNDPILSGDTDDNLCRLHSPDSLQGCESKRCLLVDYDPEETYTKACCAWDLHLWLYNDAEFQKEVSIPAIFVTMEQSEKLIDSIKQGSVTGTLQPRWKPKYNISAFLVWALGVFVATLAAYLSAGDYHLGISKLTKKNGRQIYNRVDESGTSGSEPLAPRNPMQEEALELEPIHALAFIVMASSSLFILFYFKIYNFVKVFYAIGCSNAVTQIILYPILSKIFRKWGFKERTLFTTQDFGNISNFFVQAGVLGYAWGATWLYMALFVPHPDTHAFFWITQNIMGACMCVVFLTTIQLNSIQVATALLVVAFVYDIFFVFVTPYLFHGKSIMVTVATSGGPPKADPLWCEKYPSDVNCQGGDPLPMLFAVPRLFDYEGGSSLLGLGDIVLPGLLLSFAARFDAAKTLVSIVSGGRKQEACQPGSIDCGVSHTMIQNGRRGSYFFPLVIAYAVGLMMANVAVYVMNMGQPALLYLVPCTLGTMCYIGWKQHELKALWEGPKVLHTADEIIHGPARRPPNAIDASQNEEGEEEGTEMNQYNDPRNDNYENDEVGPLLLSSERQNKD